MVSFLIVLFFFFFFFLGTKAFEMISGHADSGPGATDSKYRWADPGAEARCPRVCGSGDPGQGRGCNWRDRGG